MRPFLKRIALILFSLCPVARAETINVTAFVDQFDTPSGEFISLREAVRDAAASPSATTIAVKAPFIELDAPIEIPPGLDSMIIRGDNASDRIQVLLSDTYTEDTLFEVDDRNVTFERLEINLQERAMNAFFSSGGRLTLSDCLVHNGRLAPSGSVVFSTSDGPMFVIGCEFWDLSAASMINASRPSTFSVEDCLFARCSGSAVSVTADGGTSITIRNSVFAENIAGGGTSAVVNLSNQASDSLIRHCTFVDNRGYPLSLQEATRVDHCLFARNKTLDGITEDLVLFENSFLRRGADSLGYNLCDGSPDAFDQGSDMKGNRVRVSKLGRFGGNHYCCFPQAGSRAIDGGNPTRNSFEIFDDIRGFERKASSSVNNLPNTIDIGAVEVNPNGTLLVTSIQDTGAGSLRDVLTKASGETNYIEFATAAVSGVIVVDSGAFVIDQPGNYNINAHPTSEARFRGAGTSGDVFFTGSLNGNVSGIEVSFQRCWFADARSDPNFGGVAIKGAGTSINLHACRITGNNTRFNSSVDLEKGSLFINGCLFENNTIIDPVNVPGGAAFSMEEHGETVVWNSSFINNTGGLQGGACYLGGEAGASLSGEFRHCTFVDNQASVGSAVYGDRGSRLEFTRCTFTGNISRGGVITSNRDSVTMTRCLFAENSRRVPILGGADALEVYFEEAGGINMTSGAPNWTDSSQADERYFRATDVGLGFQLGELGVWESDFVKTRPLLSIGLPVVPDSDYSFRYSDPLDAWGEVGQATDFVTFPGDSRRYSLALPGAVQRVIQVGPAIEMFRIESRDADSVNVEFLAAAGSRVFIQGGADLGNMQKIGSTLTATGMVESLMVSLPTPIPPKFFLRLIEED